VSWDSIKTYEKVAYGSKTFDKELLSEWLAGKRITRWTVGRGHNVPRFLRSGRSNIGFPNHHADNPPYIDHEVFFKATSPLKVWLVYHPYYDVESIREEVEDWAARHDLHVEFYDSSKSWYNKNDTSMVVITTANE